MKREDYWMFPSYIGNARVAVHLLSTRAPDSTVLRSHFVEAIYHFAARPQYYDTQPEDQKGDHFLSFS